jgi:hypothetical protein
MHLQAIAVVYFLSPKVPLAYKSSGTFIFNNLLEMPFFSLLCIYRLHFQKLPRRKALTRAQDFSLFSWSVSPRVPSTSLRFSAQYHRLGGWLPNWIPGRRCFQQRGNAEPKHRHPRPGQFAVLML